MAAETVSELYFRLGLDYSDLKSDIIDAEKTLTQNLQQINRQEEMLKLKANIELNGVEEGIQSSQALQIQLKALEEQMVLQRDKINLTSAAYEEMRNAQGDTAEITQKLSLQLEQEKFVMSELERQTRELTEQSKIAIGVQWELLGLIEPAIKGIDSYIAAGHAIPIPHVKAVAAAAIGLGAILVGTIEATGEVKDSIEKVDALNIDNAQANVSNSMQAIHDTSIKTAEDIDKAFAKTSANMQAHLEKTATDIFIDNAGDFFRIAFLMTNETESFSEALQAINSQAVFMSTEWGKEAVVTLGTLKTIDAAANSIISFTKPSVEAFRELKTQADELNLSLNKTQKFTAIVDLAGADYNDVRDYVRGVQDAVIKGDSSDPEVIAMDKYNVSIQNANGTLLSFDKTLENLYQGFLKAREAGEAEAYVIMTNGQAVQDVLPFFERLADAEEKFGKIKRSTSDYAGLDELSTRLKLVDVQSKELESALESLTVPLANFAAESKFDYYKKITELIEDNREAILKWEFVLIEALKRVKTFLGEMSDYAIEALTSPDDYFGVTDKIQSFISAIDDTLGVTEKLNKVLSADTNSSIFDDAQKDLEDYLAANERARADTEQTADEINSGLSYSYNRIAEYKKELASLRIESMFGDDDYQKSLAELSVWYQEALRDARHYAEERLIIAELYLEKRKQIEQKHQQEIQKIIDETADIEYEKTHSAFEKQLRDIEKWKQAQLKKAGTAKEASAIIANAAAKEAQAFENEMDRIRGKVQSLEEKIFEQTHSQRDIDIMKLQKEVNEMIEDGLKNNLGAAYFQRVGVYQKNALAKINQNSIGNESYLANPNNTLVTLPQRNFANDLQADIDRVMASYNSPLKDFNVDSALNIDTTQFDSSMLDATNATSAFTDSLQIANQKIGDLQFNLPATSDSANSLDNITQIFTNSALPEISKQFANIAQSSQTPTNNITVQSPNINISLGGAYVFDNAMKNQLTNDISTEVATAIKSAVERATINNYGY